MRFLPLAIVFFLNPFYTSAQEPSVEGQEFFEKKIRPLLVDNCFKCHSGPKLKGHLAVDSRASLLKGGDTGPAMVPGDLGKSLITKAIGYNDPDLRMPPRGKLNDQQIADINMWIKSGAPWPGDHGSKNAVTKEFNLKERSRHWSLLPLKPQAPPAVKNQAWVRSPIDAFVLAKLEEKGLVPAAPADRGKLLRRVTFDLIGLPPTPAEIEAFVNDPSPDAFAKVVDRLLASPHYGERWARHWLDLVRYAETHGHEFDIDIPDAWRYRDYVIRAFNNDLPYNQFVIEHLAGDLLEKPRRHRVDKTNESILGTGFWLLGEAKHSPVDTRGDQADRIDNQIDVFGKTFLGMTIACARCHDHKFDAISTKDYYALAGFLQSSRPQRAFIDDPSNRLEKIRKVRALQERAFHLATQESVAYLKSQELSIAPLHSLLGEIAKAEPFPSALKKAVERLKNQQDKANAALAGAVIFADARHGGFRDWIATGEAFAECSKSSSVSLDFTTPLTTARFHPAQAGRSDTVDHSLQGALRSPTFIIPKKRIHFRALGKDVRVNVVLNGLQLIQEPIYGQLTFNLNHQGRQSATSATHAFDPAIAPKSNDDFPWHSVDVSMWVGQRAYIEILDEGNGQVALDRIVFSDDGPPPNSPNKLYVGLLTDPTNDTLEILMKSYLALSHEIVEQWSAGTLDEQPDVWERIGLLNDILATTPTIKKHVGFHKNNEAIWRELDKEFADIGMPLPPATRTLAMVEGTPINEKVFIRGNHKILGEEVPHRFLEVFGGSYGGRRELAKQLLDPARTPIVPRVFVNRLWKHHFTQGIVRTPDDFGVLGQAPTHPELLDFLATEFVKNGWSVKKMHRMMLLSNAYQMDSKPSGPASEIDPDNKLLQHMPVRRLEAEAVRDAVLAVTGRLDKTLFGPSVPTHLTPFMTGRGRPSTSGPLDGNGRRSIYLGVRRNFLNPMFLAFDYPTPFSSMGKRSVSNVPAQALTMLNNPLFSQQAELWAKKILSDNTLTQTERIAKMYLTALGRPPSAMETSEAAAFIEEQSRIHGRPDNPRAWADFAHVLFNVKEFIFVN